MWLELSILISALLSCICGVANFKHLTRPLYFILCQITIGFFVETIGFCITKTNGNNIWLFNRYLIVDLWLIGLAGLYLLQKKYRFLVTGILAILTIFWTFDFIISNDKVLCNRTIIFESTFFTALYLYIMWQEYLSQKELSRNPHLWLCVGILLFSSCCIPFFGYFNFLIKENVNLAAKLYRLIRVLDIAKYLLICYSFMLCRSYRVRNGNIV